MIGNNTWTLPFIVKGFVVVETTSFVELVQFWGFLYYFVIYQTWFVAVYPFSSWRYFPRLLPTSFCKLDVSHTRNMPLDLQSCKYKLTPFEVEVQKVQKYLLFFFTSTIHSIRMSEYVKCTIHAIIYIPLKQISIQSILIPLGYKSMQCIYKWMVLLALPCCFSQGREIDFLKQENKQQKRRLTWVGLWNPRLFLLFLWLFSLLLLLLL